LEHKTVNIIGRNEEMSKKLALSAITLLMCIVVCLGTVSLAGCSGGNGEGAFDVNTLEDVVPEVVNKTQSVSLISKSFYPDFAILSEKLLQIKYGVENGKLTDAGLAAEVESARRELQQLGYYYDYEGKTAITADDGTVYGASSSNPWHIGGGKDYPQEYDMYSGYIVEDDNDFYYAVRQAKAGDVIFIASNAIVDLSDLKITNYPELVIPDGVVIVSGRGYNGLGGATLKLSVEAADMFTVSSNVRITGITIEGPDTETHDGVDSYTTSNGIVLNGTGIEIDNCEISGFSGAGITVASGDAYIHDCYIHHIRGNGEGNGILVSGGSVKLENNLFSACRNGVAVKDGASLEAGNNVEVGSSIESMFRVGAGASAVIKNNTVLGYTQPILLEGTPKEYTVENNLFALNEKQYGADALYGTDREAVKAVASFKNNAFNINTPYALSYGYGVPTATALPEIAVEAHPAESVEYGREFVPTVLSAAGFGRNHKVIEYIDKFAEQMGKGRTEKAKEALDDAISEFCGTSEYYKQNGVFSQEIDGVIYGAYVEEGMDPIGGGAGYSEIFTTGDYMVDTLEELVDAASKAKGGEVIFIEGHANIDVTSVKTINLGDGVTLASNRGYRDENGKYSTGAVLWSVFSETSPIIIAGDGSRVSGLVLNGRNPYPHLEHHKRCFSDAKYGIETAYYSLPIQSGIQAGNNMRVDNCEIFGFGYYGILAYEGTKGIKVDHCYIHHNQANGLGYGVCHGGDAESLVEYCLFNYNRHSIAATGAPVTGYIARYNIEMGESLSHCFDIHGGEDRGDGTDIAGTYCEMYNNTFLATTYPYWLRGVPEDYQIFYHNICAGKRESYDDEKLTNEKATLNDNIFAGTLVE